MPNKQQPPLSLPRSATFRAWKLAWESRSPQRRHDAWWLCWHFAVRAGWNASGPGGVYIPKRGRLQEASRPWDGLWLLPPGSPFRSVGSL